MSVDYKYVLRIISPSPPDDGGVGIVGVVGEGEEDIGGVGVLRRLEISFSASLVGRLFPERISSVSSIYLLEEGETATAADNLGLRGIGAFPPRLRSWQGGGRDHCRGRSNPILILLNNNIRRLRQSTKRRRHQRRLP